MRKLDMNNRRYLGSKYKLLDFIDETIKNNCGEYNSVFDVFGGTGVDGRGGTSGLARRTG